MDEKTNAESFGPDEGEDITVSPDAAILADAIFGGLSEIANAVRQLAAAMRGDEEDEPVDTGKYLDGSSTR